MKNGSTLGQLVSRGVRNLALGVLVWLIPICGLVLAVQIAPRTAPLPSHVSPEGTEARIAPLPSHVLPDGADERCGMFFLVELAELLIMVFYAAAVIVTATACLAAFFALRGVPKAFSIRAKPDGRKLLSDNQNWFEDAG